MDCHKLLGYDVSYDFVMIMLYSFVYCNIMVLLMRVEGNQNLTLEANEYRRITCTLLSLLALDDNRDNTMDQPP